MVSIHSHLAAEEMRKNFYEETRKPGTPKQFSWFLGFLIFVFMAAGLRAANYDAQFNQWFAVQTNLQSWAGDFTQTRMLTVLNQPLVSHGKVWVKPGEFRWELGQPAQTIVVRRPDQLLIIYPRLKRAEKYPLDAVPTGPMKDALALLDASLPRDRATMEKSFALLSAMETNSDFANDAAAAQHRGAEIHRPDCDRVSHQRFHHRRHGNEIRRRLEAAQRFHQRRAEPAD